MGSLRGIRREALRELSLLRKALQARGLTLQAIIDGRRTTAANAYENTIRVYLDTSWSASLQDLIRLHIDPLEVLQNEFGEIMAAAGEARREALANILQAEIAKLDREFIIQRMAKARRIGRHKERYVHRDVITGSWRTVGAKINKDLGIDSLRVAVNAMVKGIHESELKVKEVGSGEVYGYLLYRTTGKSLSVNYSRGCFKVAPDTAGRGDRQRFLSVLVEISAPKGLDKRKKRKLGIEPTSSSVRNRLY
jgi:hypothetical protein